MSKGYRKTLALRTESRREKKEGRKEFTTVDALLGRKKNNLVVLNI